jgi:hypothetical protein
MAVPASSVSGLNEKATQAGRGSERLSAASSARSARASLVKGFKTPIHSQEYLVFHAEQGFETFQVAAACRRRARELEGLPRLWFQARIGILAPFRLRRVLQATCRAGSIAFRVLGSVVHRRSKQRLPGFTLWLLTASLARQPNFV